MKDDLFAKVNRRETFHTPLQSIVHNMKKTLSKINPKEKLDRIAYKCISTNFDGFYDNSLENVNFQLFYKSKGDFTAIGSKERAFFKEIYDASSESLSDDKESSLHEMMNLYCKLYDKLNDKSVIEMFKTAGRNTDKSTGKMFMLMYASLCITLFSTGTKIKYGYNMYDITNTDNRFVEMSEFHGDITNFYGLFAVNGTKAIEWLDNIDQPKTFINSLLLDETSKIGNEEAVSIVVGVVTAVTIGTMILFGFVRMLRQMVYGSMCLRVSIGKSMNEQAEIFTLNISRLKRDLERLEIGSKEYNRISKIIEKQEKVISKLESAHKAILTDEERALDSIDDFETAMDKPMYEEDNSTYSRPSSHSEEFDI